MQIRIIAVSHVPRTHTGFLVSQFTKFGRSRKYEIRRENGGFSQESKKFGGKTEGFHDV